mmetsp:Transcript_167/g.232  ORF Transcript_167/g.232 Transcript_167/m.232 type:complete len:122 (+) Transcript_167:603-968(+)|eukprot:scaffold52402_cov26-Tisochrysis_lutea.AAC.1
MRPCCHVGALFNTWAGNRPYGRDPDARCAAHCSSWGPIVGRSIGQPLRGLEGMPATTRGVCACVCVCLQGEGDAVVELYWEDSAGAATAHALTCLRHECKSKRRTNVVARHRKGAAKDFQQ